MERMDSIKFLYEQLGKDGLTDLVSKGKVTPDEYKEAVGEECEIGLDGLKAIKIKFIDSYKHEARMYFDYGNTGGVQRFGTEDVISINLALDGIKTGVMETTTWKYSNGTYEVADEAYLTGMLLKGGQLLTKCFEVEAQIVAQINAIEDIEVLKAYDEKAEFDKVFFDIPEVVEPEPEVPSGTEEVPPEITE